MDAEALVLAGARALREAVGLADSGMPRGEVGVQAVLAGHVLRKSLVRLARGIPLSVIARRTITDLLFFHQTRQNFGPGSMIRGPHGFFPHIFLPAYHGPHFTEACVRAAFPGRGPNIVYLSLTGVCPCRCEYCFASAGPEAPDFEDRTVERVARELARLRVPLVNISGGEPLARYERLLRVIALLSEGSEVRMFTTGIGLTPERLRGLQAAGLRGIFVSLDTDDPARFDRARGRPGAHAAATLALSRCADAGVLTFVNCVVGPHHFPDDDAIERFLRFVARINSRIVVNFLPQLATGRGAQADSFRTPDECEPVADRIVATARRLGRPATMLFGRVDRFMGCPGAGGKLLNVDVWGNVTVCISRGALGNLLEEPFEDIYARYVAQCRRLKVGFFCARVGEAAAGEPLLSTPETERALEGFYRDQPDSEWQESLDRMGSLLERLLVPPLGRPVSNRPL